MERGKVLALDYGRKIVGLASGDLEMGMAFPRDVIENKGLNNLLESTLALCAELAVVLVVLGRPNEGNSIVKEIDDLGALLAARGLRVEFVNEDFSSLDAEQLFDEGAAQGRLDANAAQVILQRYFDQRAA